MIRQVKVREPKIPTEKEQRDRVKWILAVLENEKKEPTEEQVKRRKKP
jgi:hypothetical protein